MRYFHIFRALDTDGRDKPAPQRSSLLSDIIFDGIKLDIAFFDIRYTPRRSPHIFKSFLLHRDFEFDSFSARFDDFCDIRAFIGDASTVPGISPSPLSS